jgi:hypothetical protein
MSEQTNDIIHDLLTTVVKEPKKRGPKPKTAEEKEAIKIEKKLKKQAEKEEEEKKYKQWIEANPYEYKKKLYKNKKLPKDDPDYDAIHEHAEQINKKRSEIYESLFKPVVTSVVPIKKYKTPMDEIREVMKVINEEEEKEKKKQDRLKKMMEDDEEDDYKMYAPIVNDPYPRDIISELIQKSNEQNKSGTGKGGKKTDTNTKKNKKMSGGKRKSKRNRNSKKRI